MTDLSEKKAKLKQLMQKRQESRKLNMREIVEEDKRKKQPPNWEAKKQRLEWQEAEEKFKEECSSQGIDFDRAKNLQSNADLMDRLESKRARKHAAAVHSDAFSTYEAASFRKYLRQTKGLKVDLKKYAEEKERLGDLAFPTADTVGLVEKHKDSREAIDRLAAVVAADSEKKASYSRRREFDADADIDYINERNKRYNELLERHYGKYTADIKQNLERGTAI